MCSFLHSEWNLSDAPVYKDRSQLKIFRVWVSVRTIRPDCLISATRRMQTLTQMKHCSFVLVLFLRIFTKLPMRVSSNSDAVFARVCESGIYLFCACLHREDVATVWRYWHLWGLDVVPLYISWVFSQFQVLLMKMNSCLHDYEYPNGSFEHIVCLEKKISTYWEQRGELSCTYISFYWKCSSQLKHQRPNLHWEADMSSFPGI